MIRLWERLPLTWRLLAQEYGVLVLAGVIFVVATLTFFILAKPDRHTHLRFVSVQTVSMFDTSSDSGFIFHAVVRLPDGTQTKVSTSSFAAAQWFLKDTCVEERIRESGRVFYKLVAPDNCLP